MWYVWCSNSCIISGENKKGYHYQLSMGVMASDRDGTSGQKSACSAALKRSRGWLVPFGLELELTAPFGWLVQLGWAGLEMEVGRIGHLMLVYTRRQLCRWLFGQRAHVKLLGLYVSGRS